MNTLQITSGFKKEIWEFNKTLFWVPVIIAALMIIAPSLQLMLIDDYQLDRIYDGLMQLQNHENFAYLSEAIQVFISAIYVPFILVALLIQLYYFTACLFDERRDLSVDFWRSLPVSDAQSIATKLLTGAILIPAIFMLAATGVVFIILLLLLVACIVLSVGFDISLWGLWAEADIISSVAAVWLNLIPYAIWLFPVYAWFMLASMFAKKAPFLWAILPIVLVLLIESFIVAYLRLDSRFFTDTLMEYLRFTSDMLPEEVVAGETSKLVVFSMLSDKISVVATLLGCLMMYATYWLRVNRSQE